MNKRPSCFGKNCHICPDPNFCDTCDHLSNCKKEFFQEIREGRKIEEYREVTPYWFTRLFEKKYRNVVILSGYPKDNDGAIIRPYRGYDLKTISHPLFGPHPTLVYAIKLTARGTS